MNENPKRKESSRESEDPAARDKAERVWLGIYHFVILSILPAGIVAIAPDRLWSIDSTWVDWLPIFVMMAVAVIGFLLPVLIRSWPKRHRGIAAPEQLDEENGARSLGFSALAIFSWTAVSGFTMAWFQLEGLKVSLCWLIVGFMLFLFAVLYRGVPAVFRK